MTVRELSREEANDLVIGAKILACGGGGSESNALDNIAKIYDAGERFTIADLSDFNETEHICIIGMVGGGITEEDRKHVEGRETILREPMITAVKELEKFLDVEFSGFVATELGPNNSVVPMMVAAQMGKMAINGDCCGRSKPKISISTTRVAGIPIAPFSIVSKYGDIQIVKTTVDDVRGELIARNASRLSGGSVSVARCPMSIENAKEAVIPNTYSLAIKLGRNIRKANNRGDDIKKTFTSSVPDSKVAFEGKVRRFSRTESGGFTSGEIHVESTKGQELKIWYQNEYLLSWLDNQQFVSCPDGFYIVDSKSGYGLTPWEEDFSKGKGVIIFTRNAPEIWTSKKGLAIFGPNAFDEKWEVYRESSSLL